MSANCSVGERAECWTLASARPVVAPIAVGVGKRPQPALGR